MVGREEAAHPLEAAEGSLLQAGGAGGLERLVRAFEQRERCDESGSVTSADLAKLFARARQQGDTFSR